MKALRNMINTDLNHLKKWSNRWLLKLNPTKTEIIIFNINGIECNLTFNFDQTTIDPVHTHTHLGIVFSSDCKWTKHIEKLIGSASKQLNVLRKLKYRLNRNYLEEIYLTFIRPVLEYASEVWDNCGQINSDRLEKVQLEAVRIVTGLPSFASINSIYIETGWEKLKTRREVRKLVLFYKIVNGQVPDYLTELVPPTVADTNNYNLRNRLNISQPSYRLSTYQQSYFPSTIKLWNTLDLNLRQLPTLPSFKSKLQQKYFQPKTVPSYFSFGDRYLSVLHARLRNKCSSLNSDLFKSNLVPSASCSCGYKNECSEHFLLYCNKFNLLRNNMLIELNMLDMRGLPVNIDILLFGNDDLSVEINTFIFSCVQKYIKDTRRFS